MNIHRGVVIILNYPNTEVGFSLRKQITKTYGVTIVRL